MKSNKIKYSDYRNERAKNYGRALGQLESIKIFHENNLKSYIIETIEEILERCKELDKMEVDYS